MSKKIQRRRKKISRKINKRRITKRSKKNRKRRSYRSRRHYRKGGRLFNIDKPKKVKEIKNTKEFKKVKKSKDKKVIQGNIKNIHYCIKIDKGFNPAKGCINKANHDNIVNEDSSLNRNKHFQAFINDRKYKNYMDKLSSKETYNFVLPYLDSEVKQMYDIKDRG